MRKLKIIILFLALTAATSSCMSLTHVVGDGAQSGSTVVKKQWYALWGLAPLGQVDSKVMAGGASNYTITSKITFTDWFLNIFTGIVTIYSQTVEVKK